jgi:hypothetical protein
VQTPEFIDLLADDVPTVPPAAPQRRLALVALGGGVAALVLVLLWLKLRPDLAQAMSSGFFWIKAAYTAALAVVGFWATERMARPEVRARSAALAGLAIFIAFAVGAVLQFAPLNGATRLAALKGVSWQVCSLNIVILAVPTTVLCLAVLRRLAPTRPFAAGFAAGTFAGALAATVYGLHCPEATFVFVSLWYSLGVAVSGLLGGLAATVALRW